MSIEEEMNAYILVFKEYPDVEYTILTENYSIVKVNDFDQKVKIGESISIRTFPQYTESFSMIPIVAVEWNNEVLLDEKQGYENFLKMFTGK